jgi:T4 RnlA family RNA ligase
MNELMPQLYDDLISLCSQTDGFYYKDVQLDSVKYRIFNYNLCSYEQFHKYPSALNCRGTMFNITDLENIRLVCLPPEKFFNYEEGNGNNIHSLGTFGVQMEKLDGSLISTYLHTIDQDQQILKLKSKASLISTQSVEAMNLLTGKST